MSRISRHFVEAATRARRIDDRAAQQPVPADDPLRGPPLNRSVDMTFAVKQRSGFLKGAWTFLTGPIP